MSKFFIPKGLFARSLLIMIAPFILIQLIMAVVMYDSLFERITSRLARSVALEISFLVESIEHFPQTSEVQEINIAFLKKTQLETKFIENGTLPKTVKYNPYSPIDKTLISEFSNIGVPVWINSKAYKERVETQLQLKNGVLQVFIPKDRLSTSRAHIFLLWLVSASIIIITIAVIFLRNQIKPIVKLAKAAEKFGKGQKVDDLKPSGAEEIRQATTSFTEMKTRITKQIEQRTALLSGVSHDLKTPLTRIKLQTEMLTNSNEKIHLREDIDEMEKMLEEYLEFARGQKTELSKKINIVELIKSIVEKSSRNKKRATFKSQKAIEATIKPNAFSRCITNLIKNAQTYGNIVQIEAFLNSNGINISVEDDGPGIPEIHKTDVFRPFYRLDESRNLDKSGVGLGLSIAQDIAHNHGGEIFLTDSNLGGLKATIIFPR